MRLSIAIEVPTAWRETAAVATATIERACGVPLRRVDPGRMHLTLRFLSEVPEAQMGPLRAALAEQVPPVDVLLTLGAAGTFGAQARTPSGRRPRQDAVVWLDVGDPRSGLRALATRVEAAVRAAGLPPEERPLLAHLTLARVNGARPPGARRAARGRGRGVQTPRAGGRGAAYA